MIILAIDPGTTESAYVLYDSETMEVLDKAKDHNFWIGEHLSKDLNLEGSPWRADTAVIEMVGHYGTGMPAGKTVFETCIWIGRFTEILEKRCAVSRLMRKTVVAHLCGTARANDSNVRQALIDRFEPSGGGATPQIGIKSNPGPLYGFAKDMWAALGVAITYAERVK